MNLRNSLVQEAARILCEERLTDYRIAKQKAVERLGVAGRGQLPDNAQIQQAVIDYQRLFGGDSYRRHLRRMRETALRVMKSLADFSPRLVGGAVSGAVTTAHRVQLHAFADRAESIDLYLHERGIAFDEDERSYRFPDGREARIPLVRLDVDGIGVDLAVFPEADSRRAPVNPADGQPFRRLDPGQAEKLLAEVE